MKCPYNDHCDANFDKMKDACMSLTQICHEQVDEINKLSNKYQALVKTYQLACDEIYDLKLQLGKARLLADLNQDCALLRRQAE